MKARYIVALLLFVLACTCALIGAVTQSQCTPFDQLMSNCANPAPWFVGAGIVAFISLMVFAIGLSVDQDFMPTK